MSLRARLLALAAAFLLVLGIATVGVTAALLRDQDANRRLQGATLPAMVASREAFSALVDQETGLRGFVLTGDPALLAPYVGGQVRERQQLDQLRRLLADDPASLRLLDDLVAASTEWRVRVAEPELASRERAGTAVAMGLAPLGKQLFDDIRARSSVLQDRLGQRVSENEAERADSQRTLVLVLGGVAVVMLGLVVAALLLLLRWTLRPARELQRGLRRVAGGDLRAPLRVGGPPEVRQVSADADLMRLALLHELEASRSAREALEQHGPVVNALSQLMVRDADLPDHVQLARTLLPAEGVLAGDVLEVRVLPDGRVSVLLLDVAGHGAEAGLVAVRLKDRLGAALAVGADPASAFSTAAAALEEGSETGERFVTCLLLLLDPVEGVLTWVNAGHPPAVVVPRVRDGLDVGAAVELHPTGPLVSSITSGWGTASMALPPDAVVLAFTDGLVEVRDGERRQLGTERLLEVLADGGPEPHAVVERCVAAARAHGGPDRQDDITCAALCWQGSGEEALVPTPSTSAEARAPGSPVR